MNIVTFISLILPTSKNTFILGSFYRINLLRLLIDIKGLKISLVTRWDFPAHFTLFFYFLHFYAEQRYRWWHTPMSSDIEAYFHCYICILTRISFSQFSSFSSQKKIYVTFFITEYCLAFMALFLHSQTSWQSPPHSQTP